MATISLSPLFIGGDLNTAARRIFELNNGDSGVSGSETLYTTSSLFQSRTSGSSIAKPWGRLTIHSGTMPTSVSTVTSFNSYSSTILCTFTSANFVGPSGTSYYQSPSVLSSAYVAAAASGTATWFLLSVVTATNSIIHAPLYHQIVGSIGAIGGSDDLLISNTDITAGQLVRIFNLRFSIPATYTF